MDKVCAFLGNDYEHFATPKLINERIKKEILRVIQEDGVNTFYVGEIGQYEKDAYDTLLEVQTEYPELSFKIYLVVSSVSKLHPHHKRTEDTPVDDNGITYIGRPFDDFIFPDEVALSPKKWSISRRNDWIINNTHYIISYNATQGRAYKFCEKARRKGVKIIELAEIYKDDLY